jgi:hypothetical protein
MTDKHPGGRPRKTLKDLPDKWYDIAIEMYSEGASDVEVKAKLSVSNDVWTRWMKEEPEFMETIKAGKRLSQAWWEHKGRTNLENNKFSATLWYMNMKNRFGWADKTETKHDATDKFAEAVARAKELAIKYGGGSE